MALFMIRSHVPPENRDEILKRYADNPIAGEGVTQLGDWASIHIDGAYHLMEADDPKLIANELMRYTDLCTYTIDPVIHVEDFFDLLRDHGLS